MSCESAQDKNSRLKMEQYIRKLNSISQEIVNSRDNEGTQSRSSLNQFYATYIEKFETFNNDIEFEIFSDKYVPIRGELVSLSKKYYEYLGTRKDAIYSLTSALSCFSSSKRYGEYANEYKEKMEDSYSSKSYYRKLAAENAMKCRDEFVDFARERLNYTTNVTVLNIITIELKIEVAEVNDIIKDNRLNDTLVVPANLNDTINDWLMKSGDYLKFLDFPLEKQQKDVVF